MIAEGQVVLFRFPQTDQTEGSLRPALVLRQLPGQYNDWLICKLMAAFRYNTIPKPTLYNPHKY
jgi:hypothetical protein